MVVYTCIVSSRKQICLAELVWKCKLYTVSIFFICFSKVAFLRFDRTCLVSCPSQTLYMLLYPPRHLTFLRASKCFMETNIMIFPIFFLPFLMEFQIPRSFPVWKVTTTNNPVDMLCRLGKNILGPMKIPDFPPIWVSYLKYLDLSVTWKKDLIFHVVLISRIPANPLLFDRAVMQ